MGSTHAKCVVARPWVVGSDDVVGDSKDIEAGAPVEIDELVQFERAVAPRGVCVEFRKQRAWTCLHDRIVGVTPPIVGRNVWLFQGRSDYACLALSKSGCV